MTKTIPSKSAFCGFTDAAFDFFEGLEEDNSREFFLANKPRYESEVKGPMGAMLASFPAAFQPFHVFRPNRDVRFASDKSPYKTHHGAKSEVPSGSIYYLHFSADGMFVAAGMHMIDSAQLERLRRCIADDDTGPQLVKIAERLAKKGITVGSGLAAPLATAPRGYPKDHPRIELLRMKACIATVEFKDRSLLATPKIAEAVLGFWKSCDPLLDWLGTNVGPAARGD